MQMVKCFTFFCFFASFSPAIAQVSPDLEKLTSSDTRPSFGLLKAFENLETGVLQRALVDERNNLVRQRGIVWAIAINQNVTAATVLRDLLTRSYDQNALSVQEEQTLLDDVRLLGFLARVDRESFQFLNMHLEPKKWRETRKWSSTRGEYIDDLLTSFSIQAIGISDRDEAVAILKELQTRSPNYLHRFAGDIVQAEFYRYIRDQYGEVGLKKFVVEPDDTKTEFNRWKIGTGATLYKWANEKMSGPPPKE